MTQKYIPFECPLCKTKNVSFKEIVTLERLNNPTNMWICNECPFIGLEWYDKFDTENLLMYFKK